MIVGEAVTVGVAAGETVLLGDGDGVFAKVAVFVGLDGICVAVVLFSPDWMDGDGGSVTRFISNFLDRFGDSETFTLMQPDN